MFRNKKTWKIERLQRQRDFFDTLRSSHRVWLGETLDPEIARTHSEIISMILEITEKYEGLLDLCMNENGQSLS
jgi:hypothetical protein